MKKKQRPDSLVRLERQWYTALSAGEIDWSVYNADEYLEELWYCWNTYSKQYLNSIVRSGMVNCASVFSAMGEIKGVVDLGCGIGYSTARLKQLYPSAAVFGTNFKGTPQAKVAEKLSGKYGFSIVSNVDEISMPIDLVFASEYFEHIQNPLDHLREIVQHLCPKYFIIANAFNTKATGHFTVYQETICQSKISRIFWKALRELGYEKVKTKLWNNRPTFWRKR